VNVRGGFSVFGGSIVYSGAGEITCPATWRPPAEIGPNCGPPAREPPPVRGISLDSATFDEASAQAALDRVWSTALPEGLWPSGYVFDAVVVLYSRSAEFDSTRAEWIVMVNCGWLG
jgi:hypothetical protein